MTLSRTLTSINTSKKNILRDLHDVDDLVCPPYIMNRHFTAFIETVFIAEMMSMFWNITPSDSYMVYLGLVPQGRRYNKIAYKKPPPPADSVIEICRAYNISVSQYNDVKHLLEDDV